jgi:SsrA-binding protein
MKIFNENKKAYFNYKIEEKFEAGIILTGNEVKAIKNGKINLTGSYVIIKNEEPFLIGAKIPPYQPKNVPLEYNPERPRKLLLHKKEINYLIGKTKEKGLTLIPLKVYTKDTKIKLEFAIARGKKQFDKREIIKKRAIQKELERELKLRG